MIIGVGDGARRSRAAAALALALMATLMATPGALGALGAAGAPDAPDAPDARDAPDAPGAWATTLLERDLPGGEFSGDWRAPTVIAAGTERIGGTGGASSDDYFLFTGLPAGAQSLVLEFSAPDGIGYSYSAGGAVLFDTEPFAYEWAGSCAATVQLDHHRRRQSVTLALPEVFAGRLYLAFNFTHGEDIAYALSVPSNALIITVRGTISPDAIPEAPHAWRNLDRSCRFPRRLPGRFGGAAGL